MINREDKKDVDRKFGAKMAKVIARTTDDSKTKALANKKTPLDRKYAIQDKAIMAEHKAKKNC